MKTVLISIVSAVVASFAVLHFSGDTLTVANVEKQETAYERVMRTGTLRCGYVLYPPYMEKDLETGKFKGLGYDFVEELGKTLNIKIEWSENVPVGGDVDVLKNNRVDAICAITGTYDPNMFVHIDFSKPFTFLRNVIYARSDDERLKGTIGYDDLNSPEFTFVGIEGDATLIYAKLLFPNAKVKGLPQLVDTAQLFSEVLTHKADLVVVEPPVAARATKSNSDMFRKVNFTGKLPEYGATLAFAKGSEKLKSTINETIDYMNLNGITDELINKHESNKPMFIRVSKPYNE